MPIFSVLPTDESALTCARCRETRESCLVRLTEIAPGEYAPICFSCRYDAGLTAVETKPNQVFWRVA